METLFHFFFQLFKISILGCIYATLTLLVFRIIGYFKPQSWFYKISRKKLRLWFRSGFYISVFLFFYMFTYFGNHGFGDLAKVPVGYFKTVTQTNGVSTFVESKGTQMQINAFSYDSNYLYAEINDDFISYPDSDFVVWNLRTDEWKFYSRSSYLNAVRKKGFPHPDTFCDFWYFYKRHWGGWRFWLLP